MSTKSVKRIQVGKGASPKSRSATKSFEIPPIEAIISETVESEKVVDNAALEAIGIPELPLAVEPVEAVVEEVLIKEAEAPEMGESSLTESSYSDALGDNSVQEPEATLEPEPVAEEVIKVPKSSPNKVPFSSVKAPAVPKAFPKASPKAASKAAPKLSGPITPKAPAATAKASPKASPKLVVLTPKKPAEVVTASGKKAAAKASAAKASASKAKTKALKRVADEDLEEVELPTRVAQTKALAPKIKADSKPKVDPIALELREYQVEWANSILAILEKFYGYIDNSDPRAGKTITAIRTALENDLSLTVICPVSVMHVWETECAKYGAQVTCIESYDGLRSSRGKQPKCHLLTREEKETETGKHKVHFSVTDKYMEIVKQGTLLVFDEFTKIKNLNDTERACAALVQPILEGTSSRYAFLSGVQEETPASVVNFLKMTGYIKHDDLFKTLDDGLEYVGVNDMIVECRLIDRALTKEIVSKASFSSKPGPEMARLCYDLYEQVLKPAISGRMVRPDNGALFDMKNGYYFISEGYSNLLEKAVETLSRMLDKAEGMDKFTVANTYGKAVEEAMVYDIGRVSGDILSTVEGSKVILCLNYLESVLELEKQLASYNPVVLHGKVPAAKRGGIVQKFNTNPSVRVIIMTTAMGIGSSLHDTEGDAPRYQFISPSHKLAEIAQAASRAFSEGVKSNVEVRIFYGANVGDAHIECIEKVLESRAAPAKRALKHGEELPMKYPKEYEKFYEAGVEVEVDA